MVAVAAREAESALARLTEPVVLLYGPDEGLVAERARTLARRLAGTDDLAVVRLDGAEVAADPGRLSDEARAISLFGGHRVVRLRSDGRPVQAAVAPLIDDPPREATVIIEAGDLKADAPLRKLVEGARHALAVPCYADGERDLLALVTATFAEAGISVAPELRAVIAESLGADRGLSRQELDKLVLYAGEGGRLEADDVAALLVDAAPLHRDTIVDLAFGGDAAGIDREAERLFRDGEDPGVLLGAALRHALLLRGLTLAREAGEGPAALRAARLHFRRQPAVEAQVTRWDRARLDRAIAQLSDATTETRRLPRLAEAIAVRALWTVAIAARRR